jgi:hypothetical protein
LAEKPSTMKMTKILFNLGSDSSSGDELMDDLG